MLGPERRPFAHDGDFRQSSSGEPWRERSGTVVWQWLGRRRDCILWNAFPWHPFGAKRLSNRRPRQSERVQARGVLLHCLSLFPDLQVLARGRVVRHTLPIDVLVRTLEWVRQRLAPNDFFLREVIETSPV